MKCRERSRPRISDAQATVFEAQAGVSDARTRRASRDTRKQGLRASLSRGYRHRENITQDLRDRFTRQTLAEQGHDKNGARMRLRDMNSRERSNSIVQQGFLITRREIHVRRIRDSRRDPKADAHQGFRARRFSDTQVSQTRIILNSKEESNKGHPLTLNSNITQGNIRTK